MVGDWQTREKPLRGSLPSRRVATNNDMGTLKISVVGALGFTQPDLTPTNQVFLTFRFDGLGRFS